MTLASERTFTEYNQPGKSYPRFKQNSDKSAELAAINITSTDY